jgi:drug/metabolite transporter (DMT)-like permease
MSKSSMNYRPAQATAVAALFAGATVWGLIWYPYRLLESAGVSGALATALTYAVALVLGLVLFPGKLRGVRVDGWLVAIALAAAGCNLGYVLGTVHGEVMRVLLLFYLAPLWTVLLAKLLLGERLTRGGATLVGLSLTGAAIMLWRPDMGAPWPAQGAEWIGLAAGFLFALSNVLIRRAHHYTIELKSIAVFVGVVVVGFGYVAFAEPLTVPDIGFGSWLLVAAVGVVLLVINVVVQYGLTRITAGRAVVILLFELVVAALGSWWLAGEMMSPREWLGGALIVAASLISAKLET